MRKSKISIHLNYFLISIAFLSFAFTSHVFGQNHQERFNALDVLHYKFEINLNDSTDDIEVNASIRIRFKKDLDSFSLDLSGLNDEHKGMVVEHVLADNQELAYNHKEDKLTIQTVISKADIKTFEIKYHGIPYDGLIISKNIFGDRSFFGDCWPNRAHHWLSCVDHPSDKATVEFIVSAPNHYQIIAVGSKLDERDHGKQIISHWKTEMPLPTKVMVIGVAEFAIQKLPESKETEISTWVYPQNKKEGFLDYRIASKPMEFFTNHIAPFPFSKLANVQAKTKYGGMENASCIFYNERSVSGEQKVESLIAHEIAHQWFGDAISEQNWHHIWISEGFASYFTNLYIENQYGKERFIESMKKSRNRVIKYASRNLAPIIDTTLLVSTKLLSTNSYQKGAWFLHMLRNELGDELFWKCIRTYYKKYEYKNVMTEDFQAVVESVSGKAFNQFFYQWLYQKGHPVLSYEWNYKSGRIKLRLSQHQDQYTFKFPLELKIIYKDGTSDYQKMIIANADSIFSLSTLKEPKEIIVDPHTNLLFEFKSKQNQ